MIDVLPNPSKRKPAAPAIATGHDVDPDSAPPWREPGTGFWLASAIADRLVRLRFRWCPDRRRWEQLLGGAPGVPLRWQRCDDDEVLMIAAEVAAELYDELTGRLRDMPDDRTVEQATRLTRQLHRWRDWLVKQHSLAGLTAALRLARLRVGLYGGPDV